LSPIFATLLQVTVSLTIQQAPCHGLPRLIFLFDYKCLRVEAMRTGGAPKYIFFIHFFAALRKKICIFNSMRGAGTA
jgi:hypothetical protein